MDVMGADSRRLAIWASTSEHNERFDGSAAIAVHLAMRNTSARRCDAVFGIAQTSAGLIVNGGWILKGSGALN